MRKILLTMSFGLVLFTALESLSSENCQDPEVIFIKTLEEIGIAIMTTKNSQTLVSLGSDGGKDYQLQEDELLLLSKLVIDYQLLSENFISRPAKQTYKELAEFVYSTKQKTSSYLNRIIQIKEKANRKNITEFIPTKSPLVRRLVDMQKN